MYLFLSKVENILFILSKMKKILFISIFASTPPPPPVKIFTGNLLVYYIKYMHAASTFRPLILFHLAVKTVFVGTLMHKFCVNSDWLISSLFLQQLKHMCN